MKRLSQKFYNYLSYGNKRTAYIYARHVDNFLRFVGKDDLNAVTPLDVTDWLASLKRDKGYKDRTLHLCLCALRRFLKVMRAYELLDGIPSEISYIPAEPLWLDEKTTFQFIGKVPVLCVAYDLALRIGEVPLLRTKTLNLDTGDIEVTRLKHKGHQNKYMLKLDNWCLDILREYVEKYKVRGKLFPMSVMWINTTFRRRRDAFLSEDYTFQCLRHSRITHIAIHELKTKGFVDELSLAKFAGHLRVETTRMYVHLASKYLAFKGSNSATFLNS